MAVFRNLPIAIPDSYTTLPHFGSNAPIAIVVGGNRFAYDTLRMHADVSKVIPKMDCFRDIFGRVIAEFLQNVFCFEKRWLWLLSASVLNNSQHKVFHDKCFFLPEAEPNTSGSQVVLLPHDFIGNRKDEDLFFCSSRIFLVFVSCVGVFFLFLNETCV